MSNEIRQKLLLAAIIHQRLSQESQPLTLEVRPGALHAIRPDGSFAFVVERGTRGRSGRVPVILFEDNTVLAPRYFWFPLVIPAITAWLQGEIEQHNEKVQS